MKRILIFLVGVFAFLNAQAQFVQLGQIERGDSAMLVPITDNIGVLRYGDINAIFPIDLEDNEIGWGRNDSIVGAPELMWLGNGRLRVVGIPNGRSDSVLVIKGDDVMYWMARKDLVRIGVEEIAFGDADSSITSENILKWESYGSGRKRLKVDGGSGSVAVGANAHAEGGNSIAQGANAHAERGNSIAQGANAHAEGGNSIAQGANAHASFSSIAQGRDADGSGDYSIAQGYQAVAGGHNSIAQGRGADASHNNSAAFGRDATTTASNQIMLGRTSATVVAPNRLAVGHDAPATALDVDGMVTVRNVPKNNASQKLAVWDGDILGFMDRDEITGGGGGGLFDWIEVTADGRTMQVGNKDEVKFLAGQGAAIDFTGNEMTFSLDNSGIMESFDVRVGNVVSTIEDADEIELVAGDSLAINLSGDVITFDYIGDHSGFLTDVDLQGIKDTLRLHSDSLAQIFHFADTLQTYEYFDLSVNGVAQQRVNSKDVIDFQQGDNVILTYEGGAVKIAADLSDLSDSLKTFIDTLQVGDENIQSDWLQQNNTKDDFIKNKPTKLSDFNNDLNLFEYWTATTDQGTLQINAKDELYFLGKNGITTEVENDTIKIIGGEVDLKPEMVVFGDHDQYWGFKFYDTQENPVTFAKNLILKDTVRGLAPTDSLIVFSESEEDLRRTNGIRFRKGGRADDAIQFNSYVDGSSTIEHKSLGVDSTLFEGARVAFRNDDVHINTKVIDAKNKDGLGFNIPVLSQDANGTKWVDMHGLGYDFWELRTDGVKRKDVISEDVVDFVGGDRIKITYNNDKLIFDLDADFTDYENVQADWDESDNSNPAYIKNKPVMKNWMAGGAIEFVNDSIQVMVDSTTIIINANNQLEVVGGGGGNGYDWWMLRTDNGFVQVYDKDVLTIRGDDGISVENDGLGVTISGSGAAALDPQKVVFGDYEQDEGFKFYEYEPYPAFNEKAISLFDNPIVGVPNDSLLIYSRTGGGARRNGISFNGDRNNDVGFSYSATASNKTFDFFGYGVDSFNILGAGNRFNFSGTSVHFSNASHIIDRKNTNGSQFDNPVLSRDAQGVIWVEGDEGGSGGVTDWKGWTSNNSSLSLTLNEAGYTNSGFTNCTLNLPVGSSNEKAKSWWLYSRNFGSGVSTTIQAQPGRLINGKSSVTVSGDDGIQIVFDGVNWFTVPYK